jgi:CRISPR/Cas system CMR-associated protein Cmr5 small subunit
MLDPAVLQELAEVLAYELPTIIRYDGFGATVA